MSETLENVQDRIIMKLPEVDERSMQALRKTQHYKSMRTSKLKGVQLRDPVSVNKWDTVFQIRVPYLNEAICKEKTYPEKVTYSDGVYAISGEFLPWQIMKGGGEQNVNLLIPMKSIEYKMESGGVVSTYHNVEFYAQIQLSYLPQVQDTNQVGTYRLKMNTTQQGVQSPVSILNSKIPDADKYAVIFINMLIEEWANKNLDAFNAVFSTVNLCNLSDHKGYEWLTTTYMSYGYTDGSTLENCVLAILCMTNGHTPPDNHTVCNALEETDTSAFVINIQTFIEDVYAGQMIDELHIKKEELKIGVCEVSYESDEGVAMDKVDYNGISYTPYMTKMKVSFTQTEISTEAVIATNISPGIDATSTIITHQTLALAENSKKEQVMIYEMLGEPSTSTETKVASWVIITEVIIGIIAAVIAIVVGNAFGTVLARIIALVIAGIVCAVVSLLIHVVVEKIVTEGVVEGVPSVTPMIRMATNGVVWPLCNAEDDERYTLTNIEFLGNIVYKGNPGIQIA